MFAVCTRVVYYARMDGKRSADGSRCHRIGSVSLLVMCRIRRSGRLPQGGSGASRISPRSMFLNSPKTVYPFLSAIPFVKAESFVSFHRFCSTRGWRRRAKTRATANPIVRSIAHRIFMPLFAPPLLFLWRGGPPKGRAERKTGPGNVAGISL